MFNQTSTYKMDSDYPYFYEAWSNMYWQPNDTFDDKHDFYATKLKFATTLISNCLGPVIKRMEYINEMKKYVQVDVYGKCGQTCPTKNPSKDDGCKDIVARDYKFYLAFENSICKDYVTEKFFYILRHPIIPVVWGDGNYEDFVSFKHLNLNKH